MSFHNSFFGTLVAVLIPLIISLILWNQVRVIAPSISASNEKKKQIVLLTAVFLFGWLFISIVIGLLGLFHVAENFVSPLVPLVFILAVFLGISLLKSRAFNEIIQLFPRHLLILIQFPRIAGYVFLLLMAEGLLPALFAIPSGYGDIFVGLTALPVAFFVWKKFSFSKTIAIAWNIIGLVDLIIAILLGVLLVFPQPFQIIPVNPTTEIMAVFPMVLVPVFAVPLGIILHVYSLKQFLKKAN